MKQQTESSLKDRYQQEEGECATSTKQGQRHISWLLNRSRRRTREKQVPNIKNREAGGQETGVGFREATVTTGARWGLRKRARSNNKFLFLRLSRSSRSRGRTRSSARRHSGSSNRSNRCSRRRSRRSCRGSSTDFSFEKFGQSFWRDLIEFGLRENTKHFPSFV